MWVADVAQIPRCCDSGVGFTATALIRPLAWEPPHAAGAALEKAKKDKKKKEAGKWGKTKGFFWAGAAMLAGMARLNPACWLQGGFLSR